MSLFVSDPAGYGGDLAHYLTSEEINTIGSKLEAAYKLAVNAEKFNTCNNIPMAIDHWRKIFGEVFPAYG